MSRYVLSEDAQRDLEQIADNIALDTPEASRKFIRRLKEQFQFLASNPESGERFVGLDGSDYRRFSAWR
jgi:plasmid stabilization system protein ParE